jgi:heme/copper-type cytochrome/quinol oxidase subunit 2
MAYSYNKLLIVFIFGSMAAIGIQSVMQIVYAQEEAGPIIRRVEIWSLFYRLMVAAFVVGAVVQGVMFYICWRFRESNPRFKKMVKPGGGVNL